MIAIPGYEGIYSVTSDGRIFAHAKESPMPNGGVRVRLGQWRPVSMSPNGYFAIKLCRDGITKTFRVHRLVAAAYIPNPMALPQINHLDGNKRNNHVSNLEWASRSQNMLHAFAIGLCENVIAAARINLKKANEAGYKSEAFRTAARLNVKKAHAARRENYRRKHGLA